MKTNEIVNYITEFLKKDEETLKIGFEFWLDIDELKLYENNLQNLKEITPLVNNLASKIIKLKAKEDKKDRSDINDI